MYCNLWIVTLNFRTPQFSSAFLSCLIDSTGTALVPPFSTFRPASVTTRSLTGCWRAARGTPGPPPIQAPYLFTMLLPRETCPLSDCYWGTAQSKSNTTLSQSVIFLSLCSKWSDLIKDAPIQLFSVLIPEFGETADTDTTSTPRNVGFTWKTSCCRPVCVSRWKYLQTEGRVESWNLDQYADCFRQFNYWWVTCIRMGSVTDFWSDRSQL